MEEKECTLSDQELIRRVDEWNGKLCRTKGGAWCLSVPSRPDVDPDMLIAELCKRFERMVEDEQARKEAQAMAEMEYVWREEGEKEQFQQQEVLNIIKSKVSEEFFNEVIEELKESGHTYNFMIMDKPKGDLLDDTEYDCIKKIYVNQTTNGGYTGDEFAGTVSIEMSENEYFQFSYEM